MGNLDELVSLNNQVNELRLQDKIGKQNFHDNIKLYQPLNATVKNNSTETSIPRTTTETSIKNNKPL